MNPDPKPYLRVARGKGSEWGGEAETGVLRRLPVVTDRIGE